MHNSLASKLVGLVPVMACWLGYMMDVSGIKQCGTSCSEDPASGVQDRWWWWVAGGGVYLDDIVSGVVATSVRKFICLNNLDSCSNAREIFSSYQYSI